MDDSRKLGLAIGLAVAAVLALLARATNRRNRRGVIPRVLLAFVAGYAVRWLTARLLEQVQFTLHHQPGNAEPVV